MPPPKKKGLFFIVDAYLKICMGKRYEAKWQNGHVDVWTYDVKKKSFFLNGALKLNILDVKSKLFLIRLLFLSTVWTPDPPFVRVTSSRCPRYSVLLFLPKYNILCRPS